jgi:hypothetical protein
MRVGLRAALFLFQAANFRYIKQPHFCRSIIVHSKDQPTKIEDSEFPLSFTGPLKLPTRHNFNWLRGI